MRSLGRSWGEFRKGRMEVDREIRQEFATEGRGKSVATRDEILRAARELRVPTEGRDLRDIRPDITRAIDSAEGDSVVAVAKAMGLPVEGVSTQTLKEEIAVRLRV